MQNEIRYIIIIYKPTSSVSNYTIELSEIQAEQANL